MGRAGLALTTDKSKAVCLYNTRIQKGGALLDDMRKLVRAWQATPAEQQMQAMIRANVLNKGTRARSADVLRRTYIPRFVEGPIPDAWKLVRPLAARGGSGALSVGQGTACRRFLRAADSSRFAL